MQWFIFARHRQPGPGAQAYALTNRRLPHQSLYGRATPFPDQKPVFQPPPLFSQQQGVLVTGLGGIQAGQLYGQPLIDPNDLLENNDLSSLGAG